MHCLKSVRIRSYSGPYFAAFGLNTERYSVSLRIQSEYGEIRTKITPNTDTFYAVYVLRKIFPMISRVFVKNMRICNYVVFQLWEKYVSKRSLIKHTCSCRYKLTKIWTLNRQSKIFLRISNGSNKELVRF